MREGGAQMSAASKEDAMLAVCEACECPSWWGRVEYGRGCYRQAKEMYADVMIKRSKDWLYTYDARDEWLYQGHAVNHWGQR